jgi:surfeit locus 1 family protein
MSRSTIIATIITVLAFASLVKLGLWQLERADEKQALFDDFDRAQQQQQWSPLTRSKQLPDRYQGVSIQGQFQPQRYFLLDNQIENGHVGYHVIGLLDADFDDVDTRTIVPVNLGWVSLGAGRAQLPAVTLPSGSITVNGWFYQPTESPFIRADQLLELGPWPMRIQHLNPELLSAALELSIAPYVVLLSETESFGFPRQWQPNLMPPEKHRAYAVTWFSLALACLIIALIAGRSRTTTTEE